MFKLTQVGSVRGDCTAPFSVELDGDYTVATFVNVVLENYKEWGYIGIYDHYMTVFGSPRCEYRDGKLLNTFPGDVLDKKVISVEANGGWSRMDYLIKLED